jgi:hypothetical protein
VAALLSLQVAVQETVQVAVQVAVLRLSFIDHRWPVTDARRLRLDSQSIRFPLPSFSRSLCSGNVSSSL